VAQGETADVLARRYGVPADALLKANGLSSPAQVQPGVRVVIPVYNAAGAPAKVAQAAVPAPGRPAVVAHAEKIKLLKGGVGAPAALAKAEKAVAPPAHVASKPAAQVAVAEAPAPSTKAAMAKADPVAVQPARTAPPAKQDAAKPAPAPEAAKAAAEDDADAGKGGGANPEFRWPARGRIIQAFKPGGNDGINIAVPEGTSVKAAESGVVAYAGSELKGYGNLILIRHPNGFVSAYANNGDIEVKRGETVKRGQVIAKSGQSGNVASPQLHFELRKGATPVDPTLYLAGL
jgi:murein DD-endopeptidase MepM/ murein hydrolase activator NlpD